MTAPSSGRHLGFRFGGEGAAIPLAIVREVTTRPRVVRVPGARVHVRGVALYAGGALPIYDLRRLDDLWVGAARDDRAGGGGHLIVCDWGEVSVGLLGDEVDLVTEGPEEEPRPEAPACGLNERYVVRLIRGAGTPVPLLDVDRLFESLGVPAADPRAKEEIG